MQHRGWSCCSLTRGFCFVFFIFSGVKGSVQKDSRRKWLKVAFLLSSAMLGYLLSGSYLLGEDGVTEVLAHQGESLQYKFIEVPCSEDYDSHKRFEGICAS